MKAPLQDCLLVEKVSDIKESLQWLEKADFKDIKSRVLFLKVESFRG